ncbi:MAG: hypothetical protein D6780_01400 [Candidatus Dadabacteria bacterium]|nr:MAG: hypothetical protein D6780_01400 [Candidatus Dadabacteria bacterium]
MFEKIKESFKLAVSFALIPRLFFNFFFFPLLLSFLVIIAQLVITSIFVEAYQSKKDPSLKSSGNKATLSFLRKTLLGRDKPFDAPILCYWNVDNNKHSHSFRELPPAKKECEPNRLDVAIRTKDFNNPLIKDYIKLFTGVTERIHICRSCSPDIVIDLTGKKSITRISSVYGLGILVLALDNLDIQEKIRKIKEEAKRQREKIGEVLFYTRGFKAPFNLSVAHRSLGLIVSVAFLVVVLLWLALKSHRKILDYFSKNGALLPMVAAIGKDSFYLSIWALTLFRVIAFFIGAAVIFLITLKSKVLFSQSLVATKLNLSFTEMLCWFTALITSFCLATIIGSIADLKSRSSLFGFLYRYFPIVVAMIGGGFWALSFLLLGDMDLYRGIITALPIFGIVPVLLSPVFYPSTSYLILHSSLSLLLIAYFLKKNAEWFGTHLDQV